MMFVQDEKCIPHNISCLQATQYFLPHLTLIPYLVIMNNAAMDMGQQVSFPQLLSHPLANTQ
jgi:hypothetical protein